MAHVYSFGIVRKRPLRNWPDGRVRVRIRRGDFTTAVVRNRDGARKYLVVNVDGYWEPGEELGENWRGAIDTAREGKNHDANKNHSRISAQDECNAK